MKSLAEFLREICKGEVREDDQTLAFYKRDASLFEVRPKAVVFPKDTEDVKRIVSFVREKKALNLSLVCRAGGSDMTGGPLGESIVLDMTRHFNMIQEVGENYATAQPGVFYRDFEKETLKKGLLLPSFPASREMCTLGGMTANNSGGEKSLRYGKTDRYVRQIKFVAEDGNEYAVKPLSHEELEQKMNIAGFEGDLYRNMWNLVKEHDEILQNAKPRVSKNSAGYALWNVWDKERDVFDLTKVLVGSQGSLGIITEITFGLIRPAPCSSLLVIFLKEESLLAEVTSAMIKGRPETFELYDDHTFKLALRFFLDFLKVMKGNMFTLALRFLPEFFMALSGGVPKLILLAEFTGDSQMEAKEKASHAKNLLKQYPVQSRIANNEQEAQKYVVMRRESFNLLRGHIRGLRTAPFIDDLIVPAERLEEFLPRLQEILSQYPQIIYTIAGHVGDGNLHIIPLMNLKDPAVRSVIPEVMKKVHGLVFSFKGSMTAEHNDGLIRTPFLKDMYGEKVYSLFEEVKNIFDPDNIFNPGKKVAGPSAQTGLPAQAGSLEYAMSHIIS